MKKLVIAASIAALFSAGAAFAESIKIGVTPGPHAQIIEKVKAIAATKGLDLEVFEFSDYVIPNQALQDGELQANSFQHRPYLDNQIADRGYDIVEVGKTVNFPMGVYSNKVKKIDELTNGATVSIPNDPTNGGRALLLLQDQGLLKLDEAKGLKVTIADIKENPKNLKIAELDAAQVLRSIDDVDLAAVNTNYAIEAGLNPATDSIAREGEKAPYVNILAVRAADKDAAWVKTLLESYHNDEVKAFVNETFKGAVAAGW